MLKSLLWFGLGYATARYLILRSGVDNYLKGEKEVIDGAQDKFEDLGNSQEYSQFYGY